MLVSPTKRRAHRGALLVATAVVAVTVKFADPPPALAHVGSVVANARFCGPPPPESGQDGDGGIRFHYVPEEADASYRIAWTDGDNDPTARLTLYYLERQAPTRVVATEVEMEGRVVRTAGGGEARDIYVSCACAADDGGAAACASDASAECFDGGARWCENSVEWDTRDVPEGVYWIAAVNNDPPYHLYATSAAPIRVSHGGPKRPVVVVVKPDGSDIVADASYRIAMLISGQGPFTYDLAYGRNTTIGVGDPLTTIVRGATAVVGDDGAVGHVWDTSAVAPGMYYIEVTVTDAAGLRTTTRSRQAISITHRTPGNDAAMPADASAAEPPPPSSCDCRAGGRGEAHWPHVLLVSFVALVMRRRHHRR